MRLRTVLPLGLVVTLGACAGGSSERTETDVSVPTSSTTVQEVTTTEKPPQTTMAPSTTTTTSVTTPAVDSAGTATYTGGDCSYIGATEFDLNTTVIFTVANESNTTVVGFSVWDLPEDVTSEQIHDEGIFTFVTFGDFAAITFAPTPIGAPEELMVTLDTPGQWGINCYDESGGTPGIDYVTMFTVNE